MSRYDFYSRIGFVFSFFHLAQRQNAPLSGAEVVRRAQDVWEANLELEAEAGEGQVLGSSREALDICVAQQ